MQFPTLFFIVSAIAVAGTLAAPQYEPMEVVDEVLSMASLAADLESPIVKRTFLPYVSSENHSAITASVGVTANAGTIRTVTPSSQSTHFFDQMYGHLETCMNGLEIHCSNVKTHCESIHEENAQETSYKVLEELNAIMVLIMACISSMTVSVSSSIAAGFQISQSVVTQGATHSMSDFSQLFIKMTVTLKETYTSVTSVSSQYSVVSNVCGGTMTQLSTRFAYVVSVCVQMKGFSSQVMNSAGATFQGYQQVGFGFSSFLNVFQK
ncbi:hypothetical protein CROQUDRAFT_97236 [Cronartium quercuum f. sp. fusiforme G11]|uniref:Uncharacterized protein n=1 Tax=Cronartium quercuum f. sp. fusiforme G11 TaxID=708437 RepID=A0A9P6N9W0_9BASI|nr:hypothetical protein CROQUDRAFT_97236 [Cronartium quercuum f. sp. fusiforme G11]